MSHRNLLADWLWRLHEIVTKMCVSKMNQLLEKGRVCIRPPPANLTSSAEWIFRNDFAYDAPDAYLKTLRNVEISTEGRLFKWFWMLPESFVVPQHRSRGVFVRGTLSALKNRGRPIRIDRGTWISDNWSSEYYHWLCDALPRLYVAWRSDPGLQLLLPNSHARPYIEQSLIPFNLQSVTLLPSDRAARVAELLVPDHTALTGNVNPDVVRGVSDLLTQSFGSKQPPYRRIYVSRGQAPRRRVANEAEIVEVLRRYAFEVVEFETLSFVEQVRLMSETKWLVANHGAGMANMMFMPAGGAVLELRKEGDSIHNCFYNLAAAMEHRYSFIVCPAIRPDEPVWSADISVDVARFERELTDMLAADTGCVSTSEVQDDLGIRANVHAEP